MRRLAAVVAAYDEAENIEALSRRLHAALAGLEGWTSEILYVIEGTDRTREIAERLSAELGGIRILYRATPSGIGAAFRRGFASLGADVDRVITLDADLNHQPEEIPRLLAAAERTGCDVLVGSRLVHRGRVEGTPVWKRLLSWSVNLLMSRLYRVGIRDQTSGFRVYRAEALRALAFDSDGYAFLPEILLRARTAGFSLAEEPIHFVFRTKGRSKMALAATSLSYVSLLGWRGRLARVKRSAGSEV